MTLYDKTIAFILSFLDQHNLQEGAKLPTEQEFGTMTGVSIVTVRRAFAELAQQGIVRREQGRGTFLARRRVNAEITRVGSLRNGLSLDNHSRLTTKVLDISNRTASPDEAQKLKLSKSASVWVVRRVRLLNNKPVIQEISVIPFLLAPNLENNLKRDGEWSLYEVLEQEYGLREVKEEQTLISRRPSPEEATLLNLPRGDWVVDINGVAMSTGSQPIDVFQMVFDAKAFAFRMETPATVEVIEITPTMA